MTRPFESYVLTMLVFVGTFALAWTVYNHFTIPATDVAHDDAHLSKLCEPASGIPELHPNGAYHRCQWKGGK